MATGTTNSTTISALLPTLKAAALLSFQDTGVTKNLVSNYTMEQGTLVLPTYGTLSVAAMTEGVPTGTTQKMVIGSNTLTSVRYGAKTFLSDKAIARARNGNEDIIAEAGREIGQAIGKQVDTLLVALFDGFSHAVGSAGTELTVAEFGKAIATLRYYDAPGPYFAVLQTFQAYNLFKDLKTSVASTTDESMINNPFYAGSVLQVPVFTSGNITVDGSDDAKGGMFNKDALAFGVEMDIDIQTEDVIHAGTYVSGAMDFAVVEKKDDYGVEMLYDAAL